MASMSSCDHRESDRLARLAVLADPLTVQPDHEVVPDRENDGGEDVGDGGDVLDCELDVLTVLPSYQSLHTCLCPGNLLGALSFRAWP